MVQFLIVCVIVVASFLLGLFTGVYMSIRSGQPDPDEILSPED